MDPYREYQDYVMAFRLREALGYPPGKCYPLNAYATLRLRRSELVRKLVAVQGDPALLSRIEQITEDLNYGFWSNPGVLKGFLRRLAPIHYPILEDIHIFEALLTSGERSRLPEPGAAGAYYLGWLELPNLVSDPVAFEEALHRQKLKGEELGLFIDEFNKVAG
jgi:hypothetical protein